MNDKVNRVARKFYPTEQDRVEKIRSTVPLMRLFYDEMKLYIDNLFAKEYQFCIFDMDPIKGIMHAGLFLCCDKKPNELDEALIRREKEKIEKKICENNKLPFSKIIWEI